MKKVWVRTGLHFVVLKLEVKNTLDTLKKVEFPMA
jgi:hypothetical protein